MFHPDRSRSFPGVGALRAYLSVGLALAAGNVVTAATLHTASTPLADEPLGIRVTGLVPGTPVILRAEMWSADSTLWRSHAGFLADDEGIVDVARQAPENGDYEGVDPWGLLWAMQPPRGSAVTTSFSYPPDDPAPITVVAEVSGDELDRRVVMRRFRSEGTVTDELQGEGFRGRLHHPEAGGFPVVVIGGSEGGWAGTGTTLALAARGFAALSLAYFGLEGLPDELAEIPLEAFDRAIGQLLDHHAVTHDRVVLIGTSKGAEAALLVAAGNPRVAGVVAYAPSHVSWACTCSDGDRASWSRDGVPVPFVPRRTDPTYAPARGMPVRYAVHYRHRLTHVDPDHDVFIPVEAISGPVLLISGGADDLWPSAMMADALVTRSRARGHAHEVTHVTFPDAGHGIAKLPRPSSGTTYAARGWLVLGGTAIGNGRAQAPPWAATLRFLGEVAGAGGDPGP